jgi:hypothetical protein
MTNAVVTDPLAPVEGVMPGVPADPLAPSPRATASPSFNCAAARSRGEVAVCNDERLAALDRQMAA